MMPVPRPINWVAIGIAALSLITTLFSGYLHSDRVLAAEISDLKSRAAALESHRADDHEALQEIRETVKALDAKIDELLQR